MLWHCVNSPSGMCDGEPDWDKEPEERRLGEKTAEGYSFGGTCKLDPATCGRFKKETIPEIHEPSYSHISILKNKPKAKGKEKKKEEKEVIQPNLF